MNILVLGDNGFIDSPIMDELLYGREVGILNRSVTYLLQDSSTYF
jgi:nucleoside-diphosphate-sugar epimerase